MLSSSLNTGSTDLRETDVQHPNTTATLSLVMSSRAFSANSGQLEAGSTTTGSSFFPSTPPFLFCSSMSMSMTSLSVVSLIAIVPESEWRIPTLIVSCAAERVPATNPSASPSASAPVVTSQRRANGRSATAPMSACIAMSFCLRRKRREIRSQGWNRKLHAKGFRGRLDPGHIWGKRQPGLRKAHADKEIERHHGSKRSHLARGDHVASSLQRAVQGELGTRLPLECAEVQVLCNGSLSHVRAPPPRRHQRRGSRLSLPAPPGWCSHPSFCQAR